MKAIQEAEIRHRINQLSLVRSIPKLPVDGWALMFDNLHAILRQVHMADTDRLATFCGVPWIQHVGPV